MGTERLVVEIEREDDGPVRLRVSGRLVQTTAALLGGVLRSLRDERAPVTVDLTDVDHIDSAGLDVLLEAEAGARRRRSTIKVVGVRESLHLRRSALER